MKKFSIFSTFLNILVMILYTCTLIYLDFSEEMNLISNDFFSDNNIRFTTNFLTKIDALRTIFNDENIKELGLFELENNRTAVGVLTKDYTPYFELQRGRYFTNDDFFNQVFVAIVGADYNVDISKVTQGSEHIEINGVEYKVIGVIRHYEGSKINSRIFYNIDSSTSETQLFCIDGKTAKTINQNYSRFLNYGDFTRIDYSKNNLNRFIHSDKNQMIIFLLVSIIAFTSQVVKSILAHRANKRIILVFRLFGYGKKQVVLNTIFKTILEALCAFLVFFIIIFALPMLNINYSILGQLVIINTVILFLAALIESIWNVNK